MLSNFYKIKDQSSTFWDRITQPASHYFTLGGCATGYSISTCVSYFCAADSRVIIQGWGNVGRSAAYFMHANNHGNVVGIVEKDYFIYHPNGLDVEYLLSNTINSHQDNIHNDLLTIGDNRYLTLRRLPEQNEETFLSHCLAQVSANVFCPCAMRYAITNLVSKTLLENNFKNEPRKSWIISGANNVFATKNLVTEFEKCGVNVLPEWLSNSGNTLLYNEVLKKETSSLSEEYLSEVRNRILCFLEFAERSAPNAQVTYKEYHNLIEKNFTSSEEKAYAI